MEQLCTPDSVHICTPLLGDKCFAVICLARRLIRSGHCGRRFVACQVLPDFTRTAATRFNCLATSRTHLPCSRLHARLAGCIAASAGRLLPYPFTPHQFASQGCAGGSALCCGCSRRAVANSAPPLAVSWGNRIGHTDWESGSSSADNCRQ